MPEVLEKITRVKAELLVLQRQRQTKPLEAAMYKATVEHFVGEWADLRRSLARFTALFPVEEAMTERDVLNFLSLMAAAQTKRATQFAKTLYPQLWKSFIAGHTTAAGRLGVEATFKVSQERAMAWARTHAAELVKGIDDTTKQHVGDLIRKAIDEGWSYSKTEGDLKRMYDGFRGKTPPQAQHVGYRSRARLIAVNEANIAYSEGEMNLARWMEEGGITMEKASLTTGSDRVCEICLGNEGEGFIPLGTNFGSGDEQTPFHVGCECGLLTERAGALA